MAAGRRVRLINPRFVKPFVRGSKNDAVDAEAIFDAASRPGMRSVPVKTVAQQDLQSLHRVRDRLVASRTRLINHTRGLLAEYGVMQPTGATLFGRTCRRLLALPGVGPVVATALVASVGDARPFRSGRELAAWIGLVPRQRSTGGKSRLGGIGRRANHYLRRQLVHGARAVALRLTGKTDPRSRWFQGVIDRHGFNKGIVAMANKTARMAWAMLTRKEDYRPA
jgi:transposase